MKYLKKNIMSKIITNITRNITRNINKTQVINTSTSNIGVIKISTSSIDNQIYECRCVEGAFCRNQQYIY